MGITFYSLLLLLLLSTALNVRTANPLNIQILFSLYDVMQDRISLCNCIIFMICLYLLVTLPHSVMFSLLMVLQWKRQGTRARTFFHISVSSSFLSCRRNMRQIKRRGKLSDNEKLTA